MNTYIFDWEENSEYVLANRKCFTVRNQFMELVALVRYLIDRGQTYEEVYEVWRSIESEITKAVEDDEVESEHKFKEVWKKAKTLKIVQFQPIKLYKKEIEFVNDLEVFPWIKEYLLTMLAVHKYYNTTWCKYTRDIKVFCYSMTRVRRERDKYIRSLSECINKHNPYTLSIYDTALAFRVNFEEKDGEVVSEIRNPRHVQEWFKYITNIKPCSVCGSSFEYNSKTVGNVLCPECYKVKRRKAQAKRRSKTVV